MATTKRLPIAFAAGLLLSLPPATAMAADPVRFVVTSLGGGRYRAAADSGLVYEGSLKFVVEQAVEDLDDAGGGLVQFAAGTFDLGSGFFCLRRVERVEFAGAGMDATMIRNQSSANSDTEPFNMGTVSGILIRDLTISAGGSARTTSDAIDLDNGNDSRIERVRIVASRGRGIVLDGKGLGWSADRNTIRDCVIDGVTSDGIELLAARDNLVTGCRITNTGGHGIQVTKASAVAATPNKQANDNRIVGNAIDEAGQDGINVNSSSRTEIRGNRVTNSSDVTTNCDGIRLQASDNIRCDDSVVDGNTATDTQPMKTQRYGLHISSSLCHRTLVGLNSLAGNRIAPVRDVGSSTVFAG